MLREKQTSNQGVPHVNTYDLIRNSPFLREHGAKAVDRFMKALDRGDAVQIEKESNLLQRVHSLSEKSKSLFFSEERQANLEWILARSLDSGRLPLVSYERTNTFTPIGHKPPTIEEQVRTLGYDLSPTAPGGKANIPGPVANGPLDKEIRKQIANEESDNAIAYKKTLDEIREANKHSDKTGIEKTMFEKMLAGELPPAQMNVFKYTDPAGETKSIAIVYYINEEGAFVPLGELKKEFVSDSMRIDRETADRASAFYNDDKAGNFGSYSPAVEDDPIAAVNKTVGKQSAKAIVFYEAGMGAMERIASITDEEIKRVISGKA